MDLQEFSPRTDSNALYRIARTKHKDMIRRCYNEKSKVYHMYGGAGVTVCEEWRTLDGFLKDIDLLEGWDLDKFLKGELSIDKDKLSSTSKVYSKNTCIWSDKRKNASMATYLDGVYAVSPEGKLHHVPIIVDFKEISGDNAEVIGAVLNGKAKHSANGWTYHKEKPLKVQRVVVTSLITEESWMDCTLSNIIRKSNGQVTKKTAEIAKKGTAKKPKLKYEEVEITLG